MQNLCKEYIPDLQCMYLFHGIDDKEMESMLNCLGAYIKECKKDQCVILCEDNVDFVGVILSGKVHMIREDLWGNRTLLVSMGKGELFGESFSCGAVRNATVSFWTSIDSKILYLSFSRIMQSCSMACKFHHRLIENMVTLIAKKNVALMDKVDILSKKTLREKISTYLLQEAGKQNNPYFDITLGRVQLAEYLCANRSALTRELNTMRNEGLIDYDKNSFHILKSLE
ncbi:Crp/Fnr family transcriptional regulator [Clostridium saccharobutylicum]|uniref:Transcriptional activator FtrB n=1 Tax=Clostridium saccharobutylicum TaxID=169679 RepID=A0A1S8NBU6_CLOSA|nr:Crp/Fnr family transcriptional regulator [Clostridium saccharobutylicum]OOM13939.1 transcriptional activator FtrB [Clostridium saccharobutylicum]